MLFSCHVRQEEARFGCPSPGQESSQQNRCGGVKEGLPSQRNWMLFEISRSHRRRLGGVDEITERGNLGNSCPEACLTGFLPGDTSLPAGGVSGSPVPRPTRCLGQRLRGRSPKRLLMCKYIHKVKSRSPNWSGRISVFRLQRWTNSKHCLQMAAFV